MKKILIFSTFLLLYCPFVMRGQQKVAVRFTRKAIIESFQNNSKTPQIKINIDDDYEDQYAIQSFSDTTLVFKNAEEERKYERAVEERNDAINKKLALVSKIEILTKEGKTKDAEKLQERSAKLTIPPIIDIKPYITNRDFLKPGMSVSVVFLYYNQTNMKVSLSLTVTNDYDQRESINGVLEYVGNPAIVGGFKVKLDQDVSIKGGGDAKKGGSLKGQTFKSFEQLDGGLELEMTGKPLPEGGYLITKATVFPAEYTDTDKALKLTLDSTIKFEDRGKLVVTGSQRFRLLTDTTITNYVTAMGMSLIPSYLKNVSEKSDIYRPFRFYVVIDPEINACAYPNGAVFINTGLLNSVDNPSQLATIMAREIAHVTNKHGRKSFDKKANIDYVFDNLEWLFSFLRDRKMVDSSAKALGMSQTEIKDLFKTYGGPVLTSRYNLNFEKEADRSGLVLMEQAGYDPREGKKIWEKVFQRARIQEDLSKGKFSLFNLFTTTGASKILSTYNIKKTAYQGFRTMSLLIAQNYYDKDFKADQARFDSQLIGFRAFKKQLEVVMQNVSKKPENTNPKPAKINGGTPSKEKTPAQKAASSATKMFKK